MLHVLARDGYQAQAGTSTELIQATPTIEWVWLSLQLSSQILLPILIVTFIFCKSLNRHITLINVCATWVFSGFVCSLLFYTGYQWGPEPPMPLCIAQTALNYSIFPLGSVTVFCLFFQVWATVTSSRWGTAKPRLLKFITIGAPLLTVITVSTITAVLAVNNPNFVNRSRRLFYCSLKHDILTDSLAGFDSIVLFICIGLNVHVAIVVMKNLRLYRGTGQLQHIIRVLLLAVYLTMHFILSFSSIWYTKSPAPDIIAASTGPVIFIFFGSSPDVLRVWKRLIWRQKPEPKQKQDRISLCSQEEARLVTSQTSTVNSLRVVIPQ